MTAEPGATGEAHLTSRIGWLRAAVLGANDGILSTAGVLIGVASASSARSGVLVAGAAALVAGALSMAAGEYVSVSSQADTEIADIERERRELDEDPAGEVRELALIYERRGLDADLASRVADQLTAGDALTAHVRDELGISEVVRARPLQAALASAAAFTAGAALPLATAVIAPESGRALMIAGMSMLFLAVLGAAGAKIGGAPIGRATIRIVFWGAVAMGFTAIVGKLFGSLVG